MKPLIFGVSKKNKPKLVSLKWYIIFTALGLSLPYRIYINRMITSVNYEIKKTIFL